MRFKLLLPFVFLISSFSCSAQITVKPNDTHIKYMGRMAMTPDSAEELSWSGSSIKINFTGTSISAVLKDQTGANYYNVIIDSKVNNIIQPGLLKGDYVLASGLSAGKHSLELFKRSEWAFGKTWFYGFKLPVGSKVLSPPPVKKHKIEFFGNSISCGYAVEDTTGQDRGSSPFENGYLSYAALTARHFDAEFHNTSKSGIGITVSWFPLIMPEMYDRLDATDPNSKWDFAKFTPDVVVINLFQNDSWIVKKPENEQFKARFGTTPPTDDFIINAYESFVKTVRSKYPNASIVCILGTMDATQKDSPWPGYIEKAVAKIGDNKIYTHFIPFKNTPGHPSVKEQKVMADDLIGFIEKNIKW